MIAAWLALTFGWVLAHPAAFFIFLACCAISAVFVLYMRHEDSRDDARYEANHKKAPRRVPRSRAGAARAARRVVGACRLPVTTTPQAAQRLLGATRRLPGAIRRHLERPLSAYDRTTLALLPALNAADAGGLRALHHEPPEGWNPPEVTTPPVTAADWDAYWGLPGITLAEPEHAPIPPRPDDCLRCGGPRSERCYVPGATGQPVTCPDDWHDEDAPGPGHTPMPAHDETLWETRRIPAVQVPAAKEAALPPMSDLLASALRELEDAERWPHLAPAAGYSTGRPFTDWERDSVVMPAIRGL